ncbi:MAG: Serine/threonine phosphatase [Bryobacterales bacterium]|nr:Serine/threonine phosphatase [Bryobacterales bacterium]
MLELEFAQRSDPGRVRGHNEDFLGCVVPDTPERARSHGWLFALADGVGGQDLGEVASRTAVESMLEGFRRAAPGEPHSSVLARVVQAANTLVYETGRAAGPGGVRMATTLVACALRFDRATVAHVGDSRCYLIRRGLAAALTRDHTLVNDQVRIGVMSAKEAARAETRHVLSRSVGNDLFVSVDTSEHQIFPEDVLLLCSDGLHGALPAAEIADLVRDDDDLHAAAERLVELANQEDGSDNVTVQLIRIHSVERIGMYRGRPYKLR